MKSSKHHIHRNSSLQDQCSIWLGNAHPNTSPRKTQSNQTRYRATGLKRLSKCSNHITPNITINASSRQTHSPARHWGADGQQWAAMGFWSGSGDPHSALLSMGTPSPLTALFMLSQMQLHLFAFANPLCWSSSTAKRGRYAQQNQLLVARPVVGKPSLPLGSAQNSALRSLQ